MKCIVEIKPEYEDSFKGVMVLGAKDSDLFVDTLAVDNLEELNSDYINEHFGGMQEEAYQRGLDDAWEAAKKLSWTEKYGGYGECLDKVFDRTDSFDFFDYLPSEAIAKLKAYEEKQKADDKIEVGDEVTDLQSGANFVVTHFWENNHGEMAVNGFNNDCSAFSATLDKVSKTGRHFDIASILEEMRND